MPGRTQSWPIFTELPAEWQPSADVYRTHSGWLLKFDLAGVRLEDVTVTVHDRRVSVSGVRRDSLVEEGCCYYSMEISYNRFERTIEMPCDLGGAQVSLQVRDGLLLVRMITKGN